MSELMLPGLEQLALPTDCRPADADMSDERVYTARVLFRDHPRVFKAAARLLFREGLSERSTAAVLALSVNTVRAIRDMIATSQAGDEAARVLFSIQKRTRMARKLVQLRALEIIGDKMEADGSEIPVDTLISVIKLADAVESMTASTAPKKAAVDEVIDVDCFDSAVDRLVAEKKRETNNGDDLTSGELGVAASLAEGVTSCRERKNERKP